ncbi:COP9 signalosome complex subunit 2 [Kwoniella heveanensis CBS 569]|uniref:COP9 signalosome complex subunit 2 n=1 Tax=Kwoniella heveanensis BCC8398 TaxID=1296120 RepID=A0A1B9GHU0_9TREE|nr:COP9 signalosome complex subunit 2 [Kwoniella heveanensis BCC8398]OCF41496.1 COP9 signalosome complex subunit 2 [Kwoniella heveanensis CBS 569]
MSDDEFMMEDAADDEEYDFDYDDDEDVDEMDEGGDVENQYYKAKSLKEDDAEGALKAFRTIVDDQPEKGEWGFKALKQMTKMNYLHLHRPEKALETYRELLGYTKSHVTRNYAEKSINNILDYVGGEGKVSLPLNTLEEFYEATRVACEEAKNERLSTKSNLKLAKLWLDRKEYDRLNPILRSLHATCAPSAGSSSSDDQSKGSLLLELYAIEIQMYSDLQETRKLKEIYNASMQVRNAIPHPRIMGVIRECGGKMWMMEKAWNKASTDLFESFRQYDESGSTQRIQVLKYLVLTYMLMGSEINPFDSQETKPYKNDPQITAMTSLVSAYQRRDVQEAEKILKANRATITSDPFINYFVDDLLRSLRTQFIIDFIRPYTRMELDSLAKTLAIDRAQVENLVVSLILDEKIKGKIDQVNGLLILDRFNASSRKRYQALGGMSKQLDHLTGKIEAEKLTREAGRGWAGSMAAFG